MSVGWWKWEAKIRERSSTYRIQVRGDTATEGVGSMMGAERATDRIWAMWDFVLRTLENYKLSADAKWLDLQF